MKHLSIFVVVLLLFLNGCSSSSPATNPTTKAEVPSEESPKIDPTAPSPTTYDDDVISCSYDGTFLKTNTFNANNFDYFLVISQIGDDEKSAFMNGNCIYVVTQNQDFATSNDYEELPKEITQIFFDGLFKQEADSSTSEVTEQPDGSYEYLLSLPEYTCKGKFLSFNSDSFTIIAHRIYNDSPSAVQSAFDSCYESVIFTPSPTSSPSDDDLFSELNRQAEETVASSKAITEGVVYDSIVAVYPNVELSEMGDTLLISIKLSHETYESDSLKFFDVLTTICRSCALEDNYSDLTFSLIVDDKFIATFSLLNYTAPSSFSSSEPFVLNEEYAEPISTLYSLIFAQNDISNTFDESLESLKEKYGITY